LSVEERTALGAKSHAALRKMFGAGNTGVDAYGVDFTDVLTGTEIECLQASGLSFVIPRGYRSVGVVDTNFVASLITAQTAGMSGSVYLFPCPTCTKSAAAQVNELIDAIGKAGVVPDLIWLDIEGPQYWHKTAAANEKFMGELLTAAAKTGFPLGIYSNHKEWANIFGDETYAPCQELPLWYPRFNYVPLVTGYQPFGGWEKPALKQYLDLKTLCGITTDLNVLYAV